MPHIAGFAKPKMAHALPLKRPPVAELRKLLRADEFIRLLAGTTLFRSIPFEELPLPTLEQLSVTIQIISIKRNHQLDLDQRDDPDQSIYEILSGYVKIYDRASRKTGGRVRPKSIPPALLAWRVPGELLGDFQFASATPRENDHIVTTDDCKLLKVRTSLIARLAQTYPQLYLNIASNLVSKTSKARVRAQILRLPNIQSKVAMLFDELRKERGFDRTIKNRRVVNGTFRISDLAAFLGYKYNSTQHAVSELIDEGLISHYKNKKSGRFQIHQEEALQRFVTKQINGG